MNLLNGFSIDLTGIDSKKLKDSRFATFQSLMRNACGLDVEIESIVRLRSKKNLVLHIIYTSATKPETSSLIAKLFVADTFQNELDRLSSSIENRLTVPKVIAAQGGVILMEFIQGEPLVDRINRTFEPTIVETLAEWYYNYHQIHNHIKGDPRLRNFIWNDGMIFGLDFEESREEHWILDIAGVAASILDTDPIFDAKKRALAWILLDHYLGLRHMERTSKVEKLFLETMVDTLAQTAEWRNDDRIMQVSNQIRQEGLDV
ncbi:MAG: hypothetical protein EAX81_03185 [Candidatus Thorarchaeota archaeon]|nr:hypothetical protein [Candidatus Thorarchaeota archaeon]